MRSHRVLLQFCALAGMMLTAASGRSQTREFAPYSAVFWQSTNAPGDILVNEVRPTVAAPFTYYNALGWIGGYTGLQLLEDGKPAFIFSLWDPKGTETNPKITSSTSLVGGTVDRFGGEGTGMHYMNHTATWRMERWYRFVVRCWDVGDRTRFALWTQDESTGLWTHHVTMEIPEAHFRFTRNLYSFLEDWNGHPERVRRVEYRHPSIRYATGQWQVMNRAFLQFGHALKPSGRYGNAYDAGVVDDHFYVQSGGATRPSVANASFLSFSQAPGSEIPDTPPIALASVSARRKGVDLTASWVLDDRTTPPFSYRLEVFANAEGSGAPLAASQGILLDARQWSLRIPVDAPGELYLRLTATDIFDRNTVKTVQIDQ